MDKKGLSQVITVLIIMLLTIVVIVVVWVVLKNILSKEAEISEAKARLFYERVDIKKIQFDPSDELSLIISLQKLTGKITLEGTEIITSVPLEVDIISVADLSGSMRACNDVSWSCCYGTLDGNIYSEGICYGILSDKIPNCTTQCGGTLVDGLTSTQDSNKQLVNNLFEKEGDNQLGLVAYSNDIIMGFSSDLTNDNKSLRDIIDSWEAETYTCICCGINEAINKLEEGSLEDKMKTIIVMSDGEANRECSEQGTGDAKQDAINAARDAYNSLSNLTIYTVGLGEEVDKSTMEAIATDCGDGQSFYTDNIEELIDIYETIADRIIKKYKSEHIFSLLKIKFYGESGSVTRNVGVPDIFETKNYDFNLTGEDIIPPIIKIEIYPIVIDKSGKEIIGFPLDTWEKK